MSRPLQHCGMHDHCGAVLWVMYLCASTPSAYSIRISPSPDRQEEYTRRQTVHTEIAIRCPCMVRGGSDDHVAHQGPTSKGPLKLLRSSHKNLHHSSEIRTRGKSRVLDRCGEVVRAHDGRDTNLAHCLRSCIQGVQLRLQRRRGAGGEKALRHTEKRTKCMSHLNTKCRGASDSTSCLCTACLGLSPYASARRASLNQCPGT